MMPPKKPMVWACSCGWVSRLQGDLLDPPICPKCKTGEIKLKKANLIERIIASTKGKLGRHGF